MQVNTKVLDEDLGAEEIEDVRVDLGPEEDGASNPLKIKDNEFCRILFINKSLSI